MSSNFSLGRNIVFVTLSAVLISCSGAKVNDLQSVGSSDLLGTGSGATGSTGSNSTSTTNSGTPTNPNLGNQLFGNLPCGGNWQYWAPAPINITSASQLLSLRSQINGQPVHLVLQNSLDFSGLTFQPLSPSAVVLEGNGHTIQNVNLNLPTQDYVGLFGFLTRGLVVMDVTFSNVQVTANSSAGILAAVSVNDDFACFSNVTVQNSSVTSKGNASASRYPPYTGLLAGSVEGSMLQLFSVTVNNSQVSGGLAAGTLFGKGQFGTGSEITGVQITGSSVAGNPSAPIIGNVVGNYLLPTQ